MKFRKYQLASENGMKIKSALIEIMINTRQGI